jgi:hypothetical protein
MYPISLETQLSVETNTLRINTHNDDITSNSPNATNIYIYIYIYWKRI